MASKLDGLICRFCSLFGERFYEWAYLKIWQPFYWDKRIKIETDAFIVYDNETRFNKHSFEIKCKKSGLDWMKEHAKLCEKFGL